MPKAPDKVDVLGVEASSVHNALGLRPQDRQTYACTHMHEQAAAPVHKTPSDLEPACNNPLQLSFWCVPVCSRPADKLKAEQWWHEASALARDQLVVAV